MAGQFASVSLEWVRGDLEWHGAIAPADLCESKHCPLCVFTDRRPGNGYRELRDDLGSDIANAQYSAACQRFESATFANDSGRSVRATIGSGGSRPNPGRISDSVVGYNLPEMVVIGSQINQIDHYPVALGKAHFESGV